MKFLRAQSFYLVSLMQLWSCSAQVSSVDDLSQATRILITSKTPRYDGLVAGSRVENILFNVTDGNGKSIPLDGVKSRLLDASYVSDVSDKDVLAALKNGAEALGGKQSKNLNSENQLCLTLFL